MHHQYEEAKLSAEEIAEIYRNMEAMGSTHVFLPGVLRGDETGAGPQERYRIDHVPTVPHVQ